MADTRFRRLAWCACAALVMAACGSDDGDTATTAEPVPATESTVEATSATTEETVGETDAPPTTPEATTGEPAPESTSIGDEAPDEAIDACAILESLDPAALLGEPAGEPEGSGSATFGFTCGIESASEATRGATRLTISTNSAAENFEKQKDLFGVDTEVTGLGDAAFHSGPYLFVLHGETFFFIQVVRDSSLGVAIDDAELEVAATKVLAALDS
jgi:hypothetical protein